MTTKIGQSLIEKHGLEPYINSERVESNCREGGLEGLFGVESLAKTDVINQRLLKKYPTINPKFLGMKGEIRFKQDVYKNKNYSNNLSTHWLSTPLFAVYSLDDPLCRICNMLKMSNHYVQIDSPKNLPSIISRPLIDAIDYKPRIPIGIWKDKGYFKSEFKGLIPDKTKEKIRKEIDNFDNNIYIVSEADWEEEPVERIDPLIIGIKKDTCFLIDSFDTTSIEDLVVNSANRSKTLRRIK